MVYVFRYLAVSLYTVFWGVIGIVNGCFDRSGRGVTWVGRQWVGWILATCGIRVETDGLDRFDRKRPYVVMCNHQSVIDIAALVVTLPLDWRFVAKRELTWIPFFGWALALGGQVIVDRGRRQRAVASLRRAAERIRGGISVIIFPEGTRSATGELIPFKSGGFHLALESGVPILPATVSGSRYITPKRSLRIESGTVKIVYGEPISTAEYTLEQRGALKERVREAIAAGFDADFQQRGVGVHGARKAGARAPA